MGGPFAVVCPVKTTASHITRGEFSWFHSSDAPRRGFCKDGGTPLGVDYPQDDGIGLMAGTLDHPERAAPAIHCGIATQVLWSAHLPDLPGRSLDGNDPEGVRQRVRATNRPHPGHDAAEWPPR